MAKEKMPLTFYGKVIGTATIEDSGEIHGEINVDILSKEEKTRILGRFPWHELSMVEATE